LIDDLFELSRLQAGELRWSMERVRLCELVEETVDAMRRDGAATLVVDVPGDLAPARAAPEQIQRVLFNLIQNAIRHTPADGSVTVRAELAGGGVQVEVADTGSGIADDDRERVFEAFFQSGARSNGGAGLGLAISRAIVEAHGGRIWLEPSPAGTSVRFTLPTG
jgi:signal transduction histidine kinase